MRGLGAKRHEQTLAPLQELALRRFGAPTIA
jgi:hypothetical protein